MALQTFPNPHPFIHLPRPYLSGFQRVFLSCPSSRGFMYVLLANMEWLTNMPFLKMFSMRSFIHFFFSTGKCEGCCNQMAKMTKIIRPRAGPWVGDKCWATYLSNTATDTYSKFTLHKCPVAVSTLMSYTHNFYADKEKLGNVDNSLHFFSTCFTLDDIVRYRLTLSWEISTTLFSQLLCNNINIIDLWNWIYLIL